MEGSLKSSDVVRVSRAGEVLGEAKLTSLRHFKEQVTFRSFFFRAFFPRVFFCVRLTPGQVKEVEKGQECGLGLDVKFEVLPDDIMEAVVHGSRLHTIEEVWGDGR